MRKATAPSGIVLVLFCAVILVAGVGGGYWQYRMQFEELSKSELAGLEAIVRLKIDQIAQWRKERRGDVRLLAESPRSIRLLDAAADSHQFREALTDWMGHLSLLKHAYNYEGGFILDAAGNIVGHAPATFTKVTEDAIVRSRQGSTVFSALYEMFGADGLSVFIDVVSSVRDKHHRIVGAVVLRMNAADFLYPLLQTWPVPSASSEVVLVMREGDRAVLISHLSHDETSHGFLSFPLTQTSLPAVQVIHGWRGHFDGLDYRNKQVMATLHDIPGTEWFLLAKIDKQEIERAALYRAALAISLSTLLVVISVVFVIWLYRRRNLALSGELADSEELRQESANLLRIAGRAARLGGWRVDLPARTVSWWGEMDGVYGVPMATTLNLDEVMELLAPDSRQQLSKAFDECAEKGTPYDVELKMIDESAGVVWIRSIGEPVRNESGEIVRVQGAIQEISSRKQTEREQARLQAQLLQSQKQEAIGVLAGGLAHDFNNMLNVILGYTEVALQEVAEDEPLYADLQEVHLAAERSASLTRQLLAFARKQSIEPKIVDLNEAVSGMVNMLGRLIGEQIELIWVPGVALWPVRIDPSQVDQMLANLMVNARDAIPDVGKIVIETRNVTLDDEFCRTHDDPDALPGDYVLLAFSDSGHGIEPNIRDKVFEPFFTTKAPGVGSGLGLSTLYGIVKQNNGLIDLQSKVGEGTTFGIYLPRSNELRTKVLPDRKGVAPGGAETILLVEDEEALLKLGRRLLEDLGYQVLPANGSTKALEIVRENDGKIDLLLTDIVMPNMNGYQLWQEISRLRPDAKVAFMSGYEIGGGPDRGHVGEKAPHIVKPYDKITLAMKVREALDAPPIEAG